MSMTSLVFGVGAIGFAAAALLYAVGAVLVYSSRSVKGQGHWLVLALSASSLWACCVLLALFLPGAWARWLIVADGLHAAVWIGFVASLLSGGVRLQPAHRIGHALLAAALVAVGVVAYSALADNAAAIDGSLRQLGLASMLLLPLLGVLALEQVFRNTDFEHRPVLRPLSIGVGIVFAVDIFIYSQALLFSGIDGNLWLLRGVANAIAAPVIFIAAKRQPVWSRSLFVSRHIVFYTASLVAAGVYLLVMAGGGYLIASQNRSWGAPLQILFLLSSAGVMFYALFSVRIHMRLKIFIAKHFYRNRYDYREEWLRFIGTLSGYSDVASLPERSVKALADIIGATKGELWLSAGPGAPFVGYGALNLSVPQNELTREDVLPKFLADTKWIIDSQEYALDPEVYEHAFVDEQLLSETPSIVVPLLHGSGMIGVVRLDRPKSLGKLTYEDHDLLRTAGRQVAIFLAQEMAQNELAESRQFEAFSKLTAFLMHDLKNLVAQQELLVRNAQRFKEDPKFIDDAIATIDVGVQRMRKMLNLLGGATRRDKRVRVGVEAMLTEAIQICSDREPRPMLEVIQPNVFVTVDRDRLAMALEHAIRNAQEATPADGRVDLKLSADEHWAFIDIEDTGVGMDATFLRERLFKAFDSTKGAKGMGIGAYQIRDIARAAGGDVEVSSELGHGTRVRLRLPIEELLETPLSRSFG